MTSTVVGLPDRYRPLDQVGADEPTPTGVIRTWRAKDRVLERDVAIRVHTPGGAAARGWISRALTAGGLATPALAMVYDAAEGTDEAGGVAYVVNEWIDGETLADRLPRGPMPERETRTVLRRLAEGVAEAHRVGLAVGGLTPEHVVLRPNGLVGLRNVPAATGTVEGDITALGALLDACLNGLGAKQGGRHVPPDLAALVRRARSTEPGQGLSSVAAMAVLLADRPRSTALRGTRPAETARPGTPPDAEPSPEPADRPGPAGRPEPAAPAAATESPADEHPVAAGDAQPAGPAPTAPAVTPAAPTVSVSRDDVPAVPAPADANRHGRHTASASGFAVADYDAEYDAEYDPGYDAGYDDYGDYAEDDGEYEAGSTGSGRRKVLIYGLPLLALALVIGFAVWLGTSVLSVASSVDEQPPPPLSASPSSTTAPPPPAAPVAGAPLSIASAAVFDPGGDGEPENDNDVPLSHDGNPATAWSTLTYRGSAHFGNLKPGVGVVYDLGGPKKLAGVSIATQQPGATVEIRTATTAANALTGYQVAGSATLNSNTDITFAKPVTARYVLVWVTDLVPADGGYSADLAEVAIRPAR